MQEIESDYEMDGKSTKAQTKESEQQADEETYDPTHMSKDWIYYHVFSTAFSMFTILFKGQAEILKTGEVKHDDDCPCEETNL